MVLGSGAGATGVEVAAVVVTGTELGVGAVSEGASFFAAEEQQDQLRVSIASDNSGRRQIRVTAGTSGKRSTLQPPPTTRMRGMADKGFSPGVIFVSF